MEEISSRRIIIQGVCQTTGSNEDVNAYRSELMGILMLLKIVRYAIRREEIREGGIILACDNEGGLKKSFLQKGTPSINTNHFDIVWEIIHLVKASSIQIKVYHVKATLLSRKGRTTNLR